MRVVAAILMYGLVLGLCSVVHAVTWHVPSPECPTIQAGVDSASAGDTVLVACGTYHDCTYPDPDGQLNCVIMKSGVCLRSATGQPDCVTIDAQNLGRVVYCVGANNTTRIEGFTITGGLVTTFPYPKYCGGGIYLSASAPTIESCVISGNTAENGGGIFCFNSALRGMSRPTLLTISNCIISDNTADFYGGGGITFVNCSGSMVTDCIISRNSVDANWGGGIRCDNSSPSMTYCAVFRNYAHAGGGMACRNGASPVISYCTFSGNSVGSAGAGVLNDEASVSLFNSIIAFSTAGEAVYCMNGGSASLMCCDVYGNAGGDWVDCIAGQSGVDGNISECPLFCAQGDDNYYLELCSPCVAGYGCGQMGAYGSGCPCVGGPSAVEKKTWSRVKSEFND
ncbi:MAG: right-handed parallel beta-helix repeat-containing protein [Candidatus Eisenbacteria sp.]|nr:right-handed parallel beta-helix repeat-containing protein [Candidatus Eisenbacteria bacterium]